MLQVRTSLSYALIWLLAGLLFILASLVSESVAFRFFAVFAGVTLLILGIRELRNRPALLEITERGIIMFASVGEHHDAGDARGKPPAKPRQLSDIHGPDRRRAVRLDRCRARL